VKELKAFDPDTQVLPATVPTQPICAQGPVADGPVENVVPVMVILAAFGLLGLIVTERVVG